MIEHLTSSLIVTRSNNNNICNIHNIITERLVLLAEVLLLSVAVLVEEEVAVPVPAEFLVEEVVVDCSLKSQRVDRVAEAPALTVTR